ncbi:MAG: hypothetical protein SFT68_00030 [Rickettsiaceae bacterium]|nr:hypothetical protein [Rickettsiaceae bacterium]
MSRDRSIEEEPKIQKLISKNCRNQRGHIATNNAFSMMAILSMPFFLLIGASPVSAFAPPLIVGGVLVGASCQVANVYRQRKVTQELEKQVAYIQTKYPEAFNDLAKKKGEFSSRGEYNEFLIDAIKHACDKDPDIAAEFIGAKGDFNKLYQNSNVDKNYKFEDRMFSISRSKKYQFHDLGAHAPNAAPPSVDANNSADTENARKDQIIEASRAITEAAEKDLAGPSTNSGQPQSDNKAQVNTLQNVNNNYSQSATITIINNGNLISVISNPSQKQDENIDYNAQATILNSSQVQDQVNKIVLAAQEIVKLSTQNPLPAHFNELINKQVLEITTSASEITKFAKSQENGTRPAESAPSNTNPTHQNVPDRNGDKLRQSLNNSVKHSDNPPRPANNGHSSRIL